LVYGQGATSMGLFRAMSVLPVIPLIDGGVQKMQPVHIDDLVDAVTRCISQETAAKVTLDVVGPKQLTMKQLLLQQRQWLGLKQAKTFSVPLALLLKTMPFTLWLDEPALSAESLKMLQRGNVADVSAFQNLLGQAPESMESVLTRTPATTADRWYAKLYFMRPLLRLGLAFLWIWTALISAFFYPQALSFELLEKIGLSGVMLPIALYGSALMDFVLGAALFLYRPMRHVLWLQMIVIIGYSVVITLLLPEYWLHPFGEISKNIPVLLATLTLLLMEKK